jgi:hypothetical protein
MAAEQIMQNKNGYGRWSMWTILAVGDAIATTGESRNKEFRNEWNGLYYFL